MTLYVCSECGANEGEFPQAGCCTHCGSGSEPEPVYFVPASPGGDEVEAEVLEICDDCGKGHNFGWAATGEHWKKVVGCHEGHLCIACFTKRSFAAGIPCHWWAMDSDAEEERDYGARLLLSDALKQRDDAIRERDQWRQECTEGIAMAKEITARLQDLAGGEADTGDGERDG